MSKSVVIHTHLGMGDIFICNGLVRKYIRESNYEKFYIVCKKNNANTVEKLYKEEAKTTVISIDGINEYDEVQNLNIDSDLLRIGHNWLRTDINFDESFYDQLGYTLKDKYEWCNVPRDIEAENICYEEVVKSEDYIFVHDKSSRGEYELDISSNLPVVKPNNMSFGLLDYMKVIENAKEIHCLNSSFLNMIDICFQKSNMYFHRIQHGDTPLINDHWTIINYENN